MKIQRVDYGSLDELTQALSGFDVVINTIPIGRVPRTTHIRLAEAAQRAGVSRYIPSQFSSDTAHPLAAKIGVFSDYIAVIESLKRLASDNANFTWSALITGPCFDYGLDFRFILSLRDLGTEIYDGGDVLFSTTTFDGVALAVVGIVKHLEETKNRYVYISQAEVTQNQLLKLSGKDIVPIPVSTESLHKKAIVALQRTPPDYGTAAVTLFKYAVFGGRFGAVLTNSENELLGVPRLSDPEIKAIVKRYSK